ncbi:PEP-CTERM sorting domain-containing protein [Tautonia sp. JC769]|uniref:PEP-CTERM sorting domain-containing protein n=1 Tax=Tautonia sp. JC769 TaxID=3232135 RepID=UPI003458EE27
MSNPRSLSRSFSLAVLATVMGVSAANADPVYGTAADPTGSRTQSNLVLLTNTPSGPNVSDYSGKSLNISWEIAQLGNAAFSYTYTFTGFNQPTISHIILDLTDDAVFPRVDPKAVTDATYNGSSSGVELVFDEFETNPRNSGGPGGSNPGFPIGPTIVGVKFEGMDDLNPLVISFTSNRAPVWGHVYVKGGDNGFAYNRGLINPNSTDVLDFIARPNGLVPEPSSLALCGTAALAGLGLGVRRLRRRDESSGVEPTS